MLGVLLGVALVKAISQTRQSLPFAIEIVAFSLLYAITPNRPVRWRHATFAGIVAAILFVIYFGRPFWSWATWRESENPLDLGFTIVEGTTDKSLEVGPGHYDGTAYPGQPGNFAVAGHRVGKGAPFNDIDLITSCEAIIVETQHSWYVYRMLPKAAERATWAKTKGKSPKCAGVEPLDAPYTQTVGQEIVSPGDGSVIAPIPNRPGASISKDQQVALMTLTTCHPKFSDKQRLIVHAVLSSEIHKDQLSPGQPPPEMWEC